MATQKYIDSIDPKAFCDRWEELEKNHGEQAALSITCEEFKISYMDAEWVEIVAKVAD